MKKLEFDSEDFYEIKHEETTTWIATDLAKAIADKAQAKFNKWNKKNIDMAPVHTWSTLKHGRLVIHGARLVDIEEIK